MTDKLTQEERWKEELRHRKNLENSRLTEVRTSIKIISRAIRDLSSRGFQGTAINSLLSYVKLNEQEVTRYDPQSRDGGINTWATQFNETMALNIYDGALKELGMKGVPIFELYYTHSKEKEWPRKILMGTYREKKYSDPSYRITNLESDLEENASK